MRAVTWRCAFAALATICLSVAAPAHAAGEPNLASTGSIDLGGAWAVALDREDVGVDEEWFARELSDPIRLPGALRDGGYGDEITAETEWMSGLHDPHWYLRKEFKRHALPGNVKIPFWPQPQRKYTGVAWYQRDVIIPDDWQGLSLIHI